MVHTARAYPVPYSKRPLKVLLFPIGWDANKSKFTPQHFTMSAQWFSSAHLYSRVGKIQHNSVTWSWNPDFTTVERIMQLLCLLPSVTFLAEMEQGDTICIANSCVLKLLGNESDRERLLCSYGCWLDHAESYWNPNCASLCETWLWQGQINKSGEVRWNDLKPLTPISD